MLSGDSPPPTGQSLTLQGCSTGPSCQLRRPGCLQDSSDDLAQQVCSARLNQWRASTLTHQPRENTKQKCPGQGSVPSHCLCKDHADYCSVQTQAGRLEGTAGHAVGDITAWRINGLFFTRDQPHLLMFDRRSSQVLSRNGNSVA